MRVYMTQPYHHAQWIIGDHDVVGIGKCNLRPHQFKNGLALDDIPLITALVQYHGFIPHSVIDDGNPDLHFTVLNAQLLINDARINRELAAVNGYTFIISRGHKAIYRKGVDTHAHR